MSTEHSSLDTELVKQSNINKDDFPIISEVDEMWDRQLKEFKIAQKELDESEDDLDQMLLDAEDEKPQISEVERLELIYQTNSLVNEILAELKNAVKEPDISKLKLSLSPAFNIEKINLLAEQGDIFRNVDGDFLTDDDLDVIASNLKKLDENNPYIYSDNKYYYKSGNYTVVIQGEINNKEINNKEKIIKDSLDMISGYIELVSIKMDNKIS